MHIYTHNYIHVYQVSFAKQVKKEDHSRAISFGKLGKEANDDKTHCQVYEFSHIEH